MLGQNLVPEDLQTSVGIGEPVPATRQTARGHWFDFWVQRSCKYHEADRSADGERCRAVTSSPPPINAPDIGEFEMAACR